MRKNKFSNKENKVIDKVIDFLKELLFDKITLYEIYALRFKKETK